MRDPPLNSSHEVWPSPFGAHFHWWPSPLRPLPSSPKKKRTLPKSLGLSQLIYSASILNFPEEVARTVKTKLFSFSWRNKRDKIRRTGLYQDLERGRIRMVDIDIMFKALKLAWSPRLLIPGNQNWKTVPDYHLRKFGGLNFLLRCNYDAKYIKSIPLFQRNIFSIL